MTEAELTKARDLVEHLEHNSRCGFYFEIDDKDSLVLLAYIRELESRVIGAIKPASKPAPFW